MDAAVGRHRAMLAVVGMLALGVVVGLSCSGLAVRSTGPLPPASRTRPGWSAPP
jgi:hypothetical protein